jgi:CheY-like chemotaxis protein/HPt (histidine-containing phosphotransfer) domain-containing protein
MEQFARCPDRVLPLLLVEGNQMSRFKELKENGTMPWPLSRRTFIKRMAVFLGVQIQEPEGTVSQPVRLEDISLDSMRILLVEDARINRDVGQAFLEGMGASVSVAADGLEALEQVNSTSFDLILTDIRMPNLDGIGFCRKIREQGIETPVVALTADAMKGARTRLLGVGMNDYLSKPLDEQKLLDVLMRLFSGSQKVPPAEVNSTPQDERKVFNASAFLSLVGGDCGVAQSIIEDFEEAAETLIREGNDFLRNQQLDQAAGIYHKLSGAAYAVQVFELGELALQIERVLLPDGDSGDALPLAEQMTGAFERFKHLRKTLNWDNY